MHYLNEGYESYINYGLLPQVMKPVHIHSFFTTKASFYQAEYKETHTISPPSHPEDPEACLSMMQSASTCIQ